MGTAAVFCAAHGMGYGFVGYFSAHALRNNWGEFLLPSDHIVRVVPEVDQLMKYFFDECVVGHG